MNDLIPDLLANPPRAMTPEDLLVWLYTTILAFGGKRSTALKCCSCIAQDIENGILKETK